MRPRLSEAPGINDEVSEVCLMAFVTPSDVITVSLADPLIKSEEVYDQSR